METATVSAPLAFIGGGNMARAIITGGIAAGVLRPELIVVADPDEHKREAMRRLGVETAASAGAAAAWLDERREPSDPPIEGQFVLAVKPQSLDEVGRELAPLMRAGRMVISILAGTPSDRVQGALGGSVAVVRAMPNLPAQIRRGITAVALGAGAEAGDEAVAERVFAGVGRTVPIDEPLMDAFTAVAGSGPAYLFYLAEAMTDAAVELGLEPDQADAVVRATLAGAAALLDGARETAPALRAAVTSKGGTTEAAIRRLDAEGVMGSVRAAVRAARDRGAELARDG